MEKVLLEDSWEADDIVEYCKRHGLECRVLESDDLMRMDANEFLNSVYFCNTDIVQHHLKQIGRMDIVPDTYEQTYTKFFGREIVMSSLKEVNLSAGPRFIKPVENNKVFDGKVIKSLSDYEDCGLECPSLDHIVYSTIPVQFIAEYRLLIGNGRLYGCGHVCKAKFEDGIEKIINELVAATGKTFRCVDIGMTISPFAKWIVVEINPPFSLDDHKIPLDCYMSFCIDACKWISREIKN